MDPWTRPLPWTKERAWARTRAEAVDLLESHLVPRLQGLGEIPAGHELGDHAPLSPEIHEAEHLDNVGVGELGRRLQVGHERGLDARGAKQLRGEDSERDTAAVAAVLGAVNDAEGTAPDLVLADEPLLTGHDVRRGHGGARCRRRGGSRGGWVRRRAAEASAVAPGRPRPPVRGGTAGSRRRGSSGPRPGSSCRGSGPRRRSPRPRRPRQANSRGPGSRTRPDPARGSFEDARWRGPAFVLRGRDAPGFRWRRGSSRPGG